METAACVCSNSLPKTQIPTSILHLRLGHKSDLFRGYHHQLCLDYSSRPTNMMQVPARTKKRVCSCSDLNGKCPWSSLAITDGDSFYEFCSILQIPINSILNPINYNSDKILPRLKLWGTRICSFTAGHIPSSTASGRGGALQLKLEGGEPQCCWLFITNKTVMDENIASVNC